MPISVEARGVQASDRLSDLIISAAHVPAELDEIEFQAFVARTLDVPPTSIVTPSDIAEARDALGRWSWSWDRQLPSLAERCLQAVVLGNFGPSASTEWPLLPPFFHPHMFEELYHRTRRLPRHARARLALEAAGRLDWGPVGDDVAPELATDLELIFEHEIGIAQSPPIKPFTIRELVRSTRAIVLVPAAAGSLASAAAMATGNWTAAILSAVTGTGSSIVLGGGLWLADKLMASMKHLDPTPQRRRLPKPRRELPKSEDKGGED